MKRKSMMMNFLHMGPGKPFEVGNIWGKLLSATIVERQNFFHFLHPQNTLRRYSIGEKNNFYGLIWSV